MTSAASRPRPPSVERVLAAARPATAGRDPAAVLAMARAVVDEERARLAGPTPSGPPSSPEALGAEVVARLASLERIAGPARVINATGVIVHTNLGRAPWPEAAIRAAREAADGNAVPRARPRYRPARPPVPGGRGAPRRADRRRGRADRHQQRRGRGARRRPGRPRRRGREPRRARRDRRRGPDPGDRAARGREAGRGRDDEPHPGKPTSRRPSRTAGRGWCFGSTRRTSARPGSSRRPMRPPSRRPPIGSARSWSTTSVAARCSTPRRSGWPTSRCRASGWPTGRTSSRSAATSSSAGPRPGSSSAAPTSSRDSGRTRWRGRCARTRSSSPRSPPRSRCTAPASPRATIPVWRQISASVEGLALAGRGDRRGGGSARQRRGGRGHDRGRLAAG